jgi:hypothetical protein
VSTLAVLLPLAQDAAEEGKHVIIGMLITGLIFISVIAIGETSKWLRHRRRASSRL